MKLLTLAFTIIVAIASHCAADVATVRVASGLVRPVFVTHAPGDPTRVFVVEQRTNIGGVPTGRVRILRQPENTLVTTPFLSIPNLSTDGEQGLLGLAFHPDYQSNGFFFVYYTDAGGSSRIVRYRVSANPDVADASSATDILTFAQPFANHNGGWIGFGKDGYLYIASGDGGSANDPFNLAQNRNTLLGKMLRINPSVEASPTVPYTSPVGNPYIGTVGRPEIWAIGLRNPWRSSFDRLTGDLWIADVGQGAIEEINFQKHGEGAGANYGWNCMEGSQCTGFGACTCNDPSLILPVHEYTHDFGCSVTGGYVYRGSLIPSFVGHYFFSDYCSSRLWSITYKDGVKTGPIDWTDQLTPPSPLNIQGVTSFGEDYYGELYICDLFGGEVFKMIPSTVTGTKSMPDGSLLWVKGAVVSRAFPGYYYVQHPERSSGIRVEHNGHTFTPGRVVNLQGRIRTNSDMERYVQVTSATSSLGDIPQPLGITNRAIGGEATEDYDSASGAGQTGVEGGTGLNNIGLLVKVWGRVISSDASRFVLDDGSGPIRVDCHTGVNPPAEGAFVTVTGPVSTYTQSEKIHPRVLVRTQGDISGDPPVAQ